jgi:2-keto-4-pentenoate hydratase/2-oxohepta-3-ene-1,7-dioic acid hydratase in catechol pathway
MRLYTYSVSTPVGTFERIGVELDRRLLDLNLACAAYSQAVEGEDDAYGYAGFMMPPRMVSYLERGQRARALAKRIVAFVGEELSQGREVCAPRGEHVLFDFSDVRIMAPVPRPTLVRDCMVFLEHFRENWARRGLKVPDVFYERPCWATQSGAVVAGTGDPIFVPRYTKQLDFELELGLYIGRKGINISEAEADSHIAGFTVFNDVSARDVQMREQEMRMGPSKGKNFEHGSIMGPCLVTPDELDYNNLRMVARVNGEVVADDNSKDMYHKFPRIIAQISEEEFLYPGDFIASGTSPHGTAMMSSLGRWLVPGDVVELEIDGIGVIRNEVVRR